MVSVHEFRTSHRLGGEIPIHPTKEQPDVPGWGSDYMAQQLARLQIPYMALVPGSSYRGLHDSLVNYNGNVSPEMLLCLHEEHSIAIAHGYGKVTEKPLAVGLHANVGLLHGSMSIYNAFTDRVPMLLIGATGPLDAMKRRPWIDWVHTAADQGALIRNFIKWDDQPGSVNASLRSLIKATALTQTKPFAPTYICLDVGLQEGKCDADEVNFPDTARFLNLATFGASSSDIQTVLGEIQKSHYVVLMLGRLGRSQQAWDDRVALAETLGARVITDIKQAAVFPTNHPLHNSAPGLFLAAEAKQMIRDADLIISFEWVDLAGSLVAAHEDLREPRARVVQVSLDSVLHNGWSKDHFDAAPADINIFSDADCFLSSLNTELKANMPPRQSSWPVAEPSSSLKQPIMDDNHVFMADLTAALYATVAPAEMCLIRVPISFRGQDLITPHPLSFMGFDGAIGLASGPGQAVGSALALKDSNLLPVAILGDGDFLMGSSALWTAAHYRIPLLVIIANNASYYNDEIHQERVAKARSRPTENKWIGMRLDDPVPDLGKNAESFGCLTVGPQVVRRDELAQKLQEAVDLVRTKGCPVLLDVQVKPDDYGASFDGNSTEKH